MNNNNINNINININKKNELFVPVAIYTNLELQRKTILTDNKKKSGVYKLVNTQTGEFYIGSSTNLSRKLMYYLNAKYMTPKKEIYAILLKYGYKNFTLEILEYCDRKNIIEREQYYIKALNPKYNNLNYAKAYLDFKHLDLTKVQHSLNNTKENHPFFGKNHTEESKIKMSLSSKKALAVRIKDFDTDTVKLFNSNVQAAKYLNVSESTIRKYKKSKKLYKKRYEILVPHDSDLRNLQFYISLHSPPSK